MQACSLCEEKMGLSCSTVTLSQSAPMSRAQLAKQGKHILYKKNPYRQEKQKEWETAEGTPWSEEVVLHGIGGGVHHGPPKTLHSSTWMVPEGLEPMDKQNRWIKLYVLTITPVSCYPVLFRRAERRQEWSETETRKRGRKDTGSMLFFLFPIYFNCQ